METLYLFQDAVTYAYLILVLLILSLSIIYFSIETSQKVAEKSKELTELVVRLHKYSEEMDKVPTKERLKVIFQELLEIEEKRKKIHLHPSWYEEYDEITSRLLGKIRMLLQVYKKQSDEK